ncbi:Calmodulin [Hexamita inflata]|uniref:Calmodulin n=1 Tax=Hexamita inflata TaxID=28002 RepID=A0AA86ULT8_9EUKA|nr:Calmodulin [Hexamita inflata]
MGCTTQSQIAIKTNEIDLTNGDLEEIFKLFDNNKDQKISAEEIQTTIQKYGITVPLKQIQVLIYCADKNGNGTIEKDEVKHLIELIFTVTIRKQMMNQQKLLTQMKATPLKLTSLYR